MRTNQKGYEQIDELVLGWDGMGWVSLSQASLLPTYMQTGTLTPSIHLTASHPPTS
jgi:hypothetical protein